MLAEAQRFELTSVISSYFNCAIVYDNILNERMLGTTIACALCLLTMKYIIPMLHNVDMSRIMRFAMTVV